jgi:LysM domain-containing protein
MAILSNVRGSLPARSAAVPRPVEPPLSPRRGAPPAGLGAPPAGLGAPPAGLGGPPAPPAGRGVSHADGRRPARLVAAPARAVARPCGPRPMTGSIGWLLLAGVFGFLLVLGIGWSLGGQPSGVAPQRTVLVQVHQGESLWTVAQRTSPGTPADAVVAKIRQLNGLAADAVLFPGELLRVPGGTAQR